MYMRSLYIHADLVLCEKDGVFEGLTWFNYRLIIDAHIFGKRGKTRTFQHDLSNMLHVYTILNVEQLS